MNFGVICFLIIVVGAFANDHETLFRSFQNKYNKQYSNHVEYNQRLNNFKISLDKIKELNAQEKGSATYGITPFSDLSPEEFKSQYLMPNNVVPPPLPPVAEITTVVPRQIPTSWDWRNKTGVISPVKDQGQCGSCWAFSATEAIESYHVLSGSPMVILSPQQLVDCDKSDWGCKSGWPYQAYNYVINAGGLATIESYPYHASVGTCMKNYTVGAKIQKWSAVTKNRDENAMMNWVAKVGPLSVCVDAHSWQYYTGGVITTCGNQMDHCVQVTGYTTIDGVDAWIVRNSWGTWWGVGGYLYIQRGKNMCTIADYVTAVVG